MLGIREETDPNTGQKKAVVNSPEGKKDLDAKTMKAFVDNAKTIQQSVLNLTAGKKADDSTQPDTSRPIGSGPPSVQEIFNEIHGMDLYNTGGIVANKGALVTKPKRKVAPKKRTTKKGLGVKTKAT